MEENLVRTMAKGNRALLNCLQTLGHLSIDSSTSIADKLDQIKAVHAQWKLEDLEGSLEGDELVARQKQRCRDIGKIVFGFLLPIHLCTRREIFFFLLGRVWEKPDISVASIYAGSHRRCYYFDATEAFTGRAKCNDKSNIKRKSHCPHRRK